VTRLTDLRAVARLAHRAELDAWLMRMHPERNVIREVVGDFDAEWSREQVAEEARKGPPSYLTGLKALLRRVERLRIDAQLLEMGEQMQALIGVRGMLYARYVQEIALEEAAALREGREAET